MTPQFTTPCYIRIDDAQQRKEVCEKLYAIGYLLGQRSIDTLDDTIITYPESCTFCTGSFGYYDEIDFKGSIKCDSIPLFLDLAAMRSDTDLNQWVIDSDCNWHKCPDDVAQEYFHAGYDCGLMPKMTCRKATATEIIEWHKKKGE